jgi:hypothetical protein
MFVIQLICLCRILWVHFWILIPSVPDPKLIISDPDPDPQIENQEFQIRILDPDASVN